MQQRKLLTEFDAMFSIINWHKCEISVWEDEFKMDSWELQIMLEVASVIFRGAVK